MRIIAFLRGINVGGHHKVPMADLKQVFEQIGFSSVKTYIQSGNVLFETEQPNIATLETYIATQIGQHFGFAIPVRLRTLQEVIEMVHVCPFILDEGDTRYQVYVSLLPAAPTTQQQTQLLASGDSKTIYVHGREFYALWERKPGETPTSMAIVEKLYKNVVTTRNMTVIRKIATIWA